MEHGVMLVHEADQHDDVVELVDYEGDEDEEKLLQRNTQFR